MRYKPIEFIVPHKVPFLYDFNSSTTLLSSWKFINTDDARNWEFTQVVGSNGQKSNALRFRNFFYTGYEQADEIITNSFD